MNDLYKLISSLMFVLLIAPAQEVPKTMTKITTKVVEPKPTSSFLAQGKTMWRAGTKYARIEEAPDTANGIHGLLIVNEPDAWMINLFEKSGRHMVDPGPTFNPRLPVFDATTGASPKVMELEFGREFEFFTKNNAKQSTEVNDKPTELYEV